MAISYFIDEETEVRRGNELSLGETGNKPRSWSFVLGQLSDVCGHSFPRLHGSVMGRVMGADEADCPTCLTLLYLLARFGACLGFSGSLPERENNQNQLFPC